MAWVSLTDRHAAMVESAVLPVAPGMTTGELRAEVAYLVLAADPAAAREVARGAMSGRPGWSAGSTRPARRAWPGGTCPGRTRWPPTSGCARSRRAGSGGWRAAWKHADPHRQQPRPEMGTDMLRARAYLMLLLGEPVDGPPAEFRLPSRHQPCAGENGTGAARATTATATELDRTAPLVSDPAPAHLRPPWPGGERDSPFLQPARPPIRRRGSRPGSGAAAPPPPGHRSTAAGRI